VTDRGGHAAEGQPARLVAVNVGLPRTVVVGDTSVTTAITKKAVEGRVGVRHLNVDGDRQADLRVHGGPDKAVYSYASEDLGWWATELGSEPLPTGAFGENLTTAGVDLTVALVGEVWRVGSVVLQVTQPRIPCYKLAIRFDDPGMPRRFTAAGRPGAYLRVLQEGELAAGDAVVVESRPAHEVSVGLVAAAYSSHDASLAARLLDADELGADWLDWARRRVERHR
jgi:MOSC domain-containing protein YiiM